MFFHKSAVVLAALITGLLVSLAHAAGPSFSVSFPKEPQREAARRARLPAAFD